MLSPCYFRCADPMVSSEYLSNPKKDRAQPIEWVLYPSRMPLSSPLQNYAESSPRQMFLQHLSLKQFSDAEGILRDHPFDIPYSVIESTINDIIQDGLFELSLLTHLFKFVTKLTRLSSQMVYAAWMGDWKTDRKSVV